MINVGVVGLGAMGKNHARLFSQLKCRLAGVADVNVELASETGKTYGVPYYGDYRDLISRVEAVSIAVPTTLHHKVAMAFLKAGVHCLVEKPIAFNLQEAREMIEIAHSNRVNLAIGHIEQFNPAITKLKEFIDSGILGRLLIISTRRVGPYIPRIRDVGIVVDSATHDIGVANYLLDSLPLSVYSKVGRLKHSKEDHAIIVLDYGETAASIEVNWFTPRKVRTLVATGSEGIAYLDYIEQTLVLNNTHLIEKVAIQKAEPLKLELEDFLDSIYQKRRPAVTGEEGINILNLALTATRTSGRVIKQQNITGTSDRS